MFKKLALIGTTFLVGCSSQPNKAPNIIFGQQTDFSSTSKVLLTSNPVPLGRTALTVGDKFAFNNPSEVWTVVAIKNGYVNWLNQDGSYMTTFYQGWLPPVQWGGRSTIKDEGHRFITDFKSNKSSVKLSGGDNLSYTVKLVQGRPGEQFNSQWKCSVGDKVTIQVPAGSAVTYEVLCFENGIERVLLNYSEELGFYVRHVLATDTGPVVRELVGYQKAK
ncbi:hypothetical protein [Pseudoalteromonas gelatinilytica]